MRVTDGKIEEATYTELYQNWKDNEFDKLYTFSEYVTAVKSTGCNIQEEPNEKN